MYNNAKRKTGQTASLKLETRVFVLAESFSCRILPEIKIIKRESKTKNESLRLLALCGVYSYRTISSKGELQMDFNKKIQESVDISDHQCTKSRDKDSFIYY